MDETEKKGCQFTEGEIENMRFVRKIHEEGLYWMLQILLVQFEPKKEIATLLRQATILLREEDQERRGKSRDAI